MRAGLDSLGVAYVIDHRLVRGFDYYTRTTFEFAADALDAAQNGVGGGGRYDGLVELLGGDPTPGIGFGIGVERVLLACDAEGVFSTESVVAAHPLHAYVIDTAGGESAVALTAELRRAGLRADRAFDGRSMKSQFKSADRSGALVALVVGERELAAGTVSLAAAAQRRGAAQRAPQCHRGGARGVPRRDGAGCGAALTTALPSPAQPSPAIHEPTRLSPETLPS